MKTAISIPDNIFNEAEELANKLGISRSHLFTIALKEYLEENNDKNVTNKLNEIYSNNDSKISKYFIDAQSLSLNQDENEW